MKKWKCLAAVSLTGVLGVGLAVVPAGTALAEDAGTVAPSFPVVSPYGLPVSGTVAIGSGQLPPDDPASGLIAADSGLVDALMDETADVPLPEFGDTIESDATALNFADHTIAAASATAGNPANCF